MPLKEIGKTPSSGDNRIRLDMRMQGKVQKKKLDSSCEVRRGAWRHTVKASETDAAFRHLPINAVATLDNLVNEREIADALVEN